MADNKGDSRSIFHATKAVSGTNTSFGGKQPTMRDDGKRIQTQEELAAIFQKFLLKKFAKTEKEELRAELEALPDGLGELTRKEFETAVKRMKPVKATGKDGIAVEVWKHSKVTKDMLFTFLEPIWKNESIPPDLVVCIFIMIYKQKGSPEDCSNYRAIGLLNHAYKILSVILLGRIVEECGHFFSEWQSGFRKGRGYRDNILLLRILYDNIIRGDKSCTVTYIDYAAAFDSVSHKFLDAALAKAGAKRKTRKIFRSIYEAAAGTVRINGTNGTHVFAENFNLERGVIQGDIISPILFILAIDQLVQTYDTHGTGHKCSEILTIRILGYADDAALIEPRVDDMTCRLTTLADASWDEADMKVRPHGQNLLTSCLQAHGADSHNCRGDRRTDQVQA